MSPILVRPVREQLEHDRVIRLLQAKLKRKHDVAINVADEQTAGIKTGPGQMFPDLVLSSPDKAHRLEGLIEVETGESVNHLEAMAQWAHFGRIKAPFYLYVPASAVDIARRLCAENDVTVAEIWSYHALGDQTRFNLVVRSAAPAAKAAPVKTANGTTASGKNVNGKNGNGKPGGPAKPAAKPKPAKAVSKAKAKPKAKSAPKKTKRK